MRQGGKLHDFASYAAGTTHKYLDEKLLPIHQYMEASGFMNANAAYAYRQLIKAINYSQYKMRSSRMQSMGGAKYWASNIELTARLFETYVREKINATGRNDFLARFRPLESFESADQGYMDATGKSRYPYPTAEEMQEFTPLLDNFFSSLTHTPQPDGNVATFSIETTDSFSVKAVNTEAQSALTFESTPGTKAEKVKESLERLKNTELHCINAPEIVATVKARQRGKLVSPEARNKSLANGFSQDQHLALAARVDDLYKYAIPLGEYNDKNAARNVEAVFRFAAPANIDGKIAFALLTLKRSEGNKLYSLELEEINQLGGTLDRVSHLLKEKPSHIPLRAAADIVAELAAKVKEYFGENAFDTQPTTTYSIAPAAPLEQRFAGNPLAERMSHYLHREARRFARILGNTTPHDTAVNAIASANAVISMLDKYVHTNKIPLGRNERTRLNLLQRLIEKYAQIIKVGKIRKNPPLPSIFCVILNFF